jgi:hypothetical protein
MDRVQKNTFTDYNIYLAYINKREKDRKRLNT